MGVGAASGKDKAEVAARAAISSPMIETSMKGATGVLISITASPDIGLEDVDTATTIISKEAAPGANVIWGVAFDNELDDEMRITIIATGFDKKPEDEAPAAKVQTAAKKTVVREAASEADDDDDWASYIGAFGSKK